jgi:hypothetical protein
MTSRVGVFINYMSCIEERRYCKDLDAVLDVLGTGRSRAIEMVAEVYQRAYGAPLFDDLRQPPPRVHASLDAIRRARAAQLMLYICAVDLIGREHRLAWLGGYSLGYGGVFVIAGMLSLDDLLLQVLPIIRPYSEDNLRRWNAADLRSIFLYAPGASRFNDDAKAVIARRYPAIRVKDDRPPFALQVAGTESELVKLRRDMLDRYPAAIAASTDIIRCDSAHLHPERYAAIADSLDAIRFRAAACDILTHRDGVLRGDLAAIAGGGALFRSIHAPLRMSSIVERMVPYRAPVILVGSERVSRFAFYGFGDALSDCTFYDWEDVLLRRVPLEPRAMPQDGVSW